MNVWQAYTEIWKAAPAAVQPPFTVCLYSSRQINDLPRSMATIYGNIALPRSMEGSGALIAASQRGEHAASKARLPSQTLPNGTGLQVEIGSPVRPNSGFLLPQERRCTNWRRSLQFCLSLPRRSSPSRRPFRRRSTLSDKTKSPELN